MDSISQSPPSEDIIGSKSKKSKLGEEPVPDCPTSSLHVTLAPPSANRTHA